MRDSQAKFETLHERQDNAKCIVSLRHSPGLIYPVRHPELVTPAQQHVSVTLVSQPFDLRFTVTHI